MNAAGVEEVARAALRALSARDSTAFGELCDENVEIVTARNTHRGREAARVWASKSYDNLDRRYAVDRVDLEGERALIHGHVEYLWRDGGGLADRSPVRLEAVVRDGRLASLHMGD